MVTSKFQFMLIGLFLIGTFDIYGQPKTAAVVLSNELIRFDAMIRRDTVELKKLLADDLVYIHSNALQENKLDHLNTIATGKIIYQKLDREEAMVRFYGKTALVTGSIKVKGILHGNPFEVSMLYTSIYRKKKHRWELIHWQSTRRP